LFSHAHSLPLPLPLPPSTWHTQAQSLVKRHGEGDMALRLLLSECKVLLRTQAAAAAARRASKKTFLPPFFLVRQARAHRRPFSTPPPLRLGLQSLPDDARLACDFQTKWARGELNPALRDVFGL
jgi:hypothetical protein